MIMAEYEPCAECKNPDVMYLCRHCGKCGRIFENGVCVNIGCFPPVDPETDKEWPDKSP